MDRVHTVRFTLAAACFYWYESDGLRVGAQAEAGAGQAAGPDKRPSCKHTEGGDHEEFGFVTGALDDGGRTIEHDQRKTPAISLTVGWELHFVRTPY